MEADRVLIYWSMEGCAHERASEESLVPPMSASTQVSYVNLGIEDRNFTWKILTYALLLFILPRFLLLMVTSLIQNLLNVTKTFSCFAICKTAICFWTCHKEPCLTSSFYNETVKQLGRVVRG